jgi:hypothetical protein
MAIPVSVRAKNTRTATTTTSVVPRIHTACGRNVAPRKRIGVSPENEGRLAASLPQASMAAPFRKIEPPMVMMMRLVTDTWRSGASVSRSSARPMRVTLTMAPAQARTSGSPACVNATAVMPPSITNSP